jgi:hypothetical protein
VDHLLEYTSLLSYAHGEDVGVPSSNSDLTDVLPCQKVSWVAFLLSFLITSLRPKVGDKHHKNHFANRVFISPSAPSDMFYGSAVRVAAVSFAVVSSCSKLQPQLVANHTAFDFVNVNPWSIIGQH